MVRAWVNHYGAMHAALKSAARSRAAVDTGKYREVNGGESAGNAIVATSPKPASTTFILHRDHPTTVWRRRKNLYCFSAIWNLEQAQASGKPCRLLSSTPW